MGRQDFKFIVIGSGAAGRTAALLAAKAKIKTALIENDKWGGSTLNTRDIPYAAMLKVSQTYDSAVKSARFGISSSSLRYNYPTLSAWRKTAIKTAGGNSKKELEDAGVTCFHGLAHFLSAHEISVGDKKITGEKFLIATGSVMREHGLVGVESVECLTPATALQVERIPKAVFVVGAGSTGCEIAQYFANLGAKVLLADVAKQILPKEDEEVGRFMEQCLSGRSKIQVLTESRVVAVEQNEKSKKVIFIRGGQEKSVNVDAIVLATGAKPAVDLGLENAGVKLNERGGIKVNNGLQTSRSNIFAAGDVLGGESSTEKAIYEATLVTSNIINHSKAIVNYNGFMRVTDTCPKVAKVGLSEKECKILKRKVKTTLVPLSETTIANVSDFKVGFLKLSVDRKGIIVGATAVTPEADLVLQEIALAVRYGLSAREVAGTPHVANGWSEAVRLAARRLAK